MINTRWRRHNNSGPNNSGHNNSGHNNSGHNNSDPFDARPILASHGDYEFGAAHLGGYLGDLGDLGGNRGGNRGGAACSVHLSRLEPLKMSRG